MIEKILRHLKNRSLLKAVKMNLGKFLPEPIGIITMFPLKSRLWRKLYFSENINDSETEDGYFPFIYQERKKRYSHKQWHLPKVEIIKGKRSKEMSKVNNTSGPFIVPIGINNEKTKITILNGDSAQTLKGFSPNRCIYVPVSYSNKINITADREVIFGNPIEMAQSMKTSHKLVLQIFIDGLGALAFKDKSITELMPYTKRNI